MISLGASERAEDDQDKTQRDVTVKFPRPRPCKTLMFRGVMKHAELAFLKTDNVPPAAFDFNGRWLNELGSYMDITVQGQVVSGTYVSAVSEAGGPTPPFALQGSAVGDLISFTVNWGEAITSWVGHGIISNGQVQIRQCRTREVAKPTRAVFTEEVETSRELSAISSGIDKATCLRRELSIQR